MSTTTIEAPVRRVVFYEDRAQVVRQAKVRLSAGSSQLRMDGISPVAVDGSLLVKAEGARVDEARVGRRWRIGKEEQPADTAALTSTLDGLRRERALLEGKKQAEEMRLLRLEKAADLRMESVGIEMPVSAAFSDSWRKEIEAFEALARQAEDQLASLGAGIRDLDRRIAVVEGRLRAVGPFEPVLEAFLTVDLTVAMEGDVELSIQYIVPCALWRPMHRAVLSGGDLTFSCGAAAWQATGEEWRDIEAAFSTARPSRPSEPPILTDDVLTVRKRIEKQTVVAMREQEISTTGEGKDRLVDEIPGVDDGGESRLLSSPARISLRPDGRMSWIPLHSFQVKADLDRVCRPERASAVVRRSMQVNTSASPVLAGPVELIRDGGSAGSTEVTFVAAGEQFALAWGPDEAIRVQRESEEHRETVRLTGRQNVTRTVTVFLSNLENRRAGFLLEERIPVSEIEDVTIEILAKDSTPGLLADDQGIVTHSVSLEPLKTEKVKLVYRLSAPSSVKGI